MDYARKGNLGIIYAEESNMGISHPFFVLILEAFRKEAAERGYEITFINNLVVGKKVGYLEYCQQEAVDGICLVCVNFEDEGVKELVSSSIPCLTVDHIYRKVPAVLSDNETGIQKLVDYAVSQGHKRIAFVHGHNNSIVTRTRISQFQSSMKSHDLSVPEEYIKEGLYHDIPLARKLVGELLEMEERPSCILLSDDLCYLGAQEAARDYGLRIPEDISFAGYDGIPITQSLEPKLTTIQQDTAKIGSLSAKRLIELIENPQKTPKYPMVLPVELLEGGTIGPWKE